MSDSHRHYNEWCLCTGDEQEVDSQIFSICWWQGEFWGGLLLVKTNKQTNKKHQHHHEQKYQEPQRETVSQENCYPVKSTHCSMFLLEEFSCTCSEQSQQYWSIWCLLGCLVPMISAQDGGFYSSGFVHSAPYHCAHFSSQQLSTIWKALVYVVIFKCLKERWTLLLALIKVLIIES